MLTKKGVKPIKTNINGIQIDVRSKHSLYVTIDDIVFYLEHSTVAPMFIECWDKGNTEDRAIHFQPTYKTLSKYHSNLGKDGCLQLYCPYCLDEVYVGHLSWSALKCIHCKEYVDKTDFFLKWDNS